ncbi:MAG TPA: glutamate mutase L [Anaerolineales bacterium]|nr:glutamate mutase L [Anaerolineales bacterium]
MATSLIDADSLLVIDIGTVATRAILFDVVDGRYRFLAVGTGPTTDRAPYRDVREGVRQAIDQLQLITSRALIGGNENLIIPSTPDGSGVDSCAVIMSTGTPLKMVVVGLLEDVSLESARRLAATTYTGVVDTISLNDRRKTETRIDLILRLRPDMILVAGGTEKGASQSILKLIEPVGLACYLMPEKQRPEILYVGNEALRTEVQSSLKSIVNLHFAPNVRPDLEVEQLGSAQSELGKIYRRVRARQIIGVEELDKWAGGRLMPSATAFGRIVHFLSRSYASSNGVLGVDIGANATTIAAAYEDDLHLGVYPQYGLGQGMNDLLKSIPLSQITRWLTADTSEEYVRSYIQNKAIYPLTVPASAEDMGIEQALVRQLLQAAVKRSKPGFPDGLQGSSNGLLPWFKIIVASGAALTKAPSLGQALLMLLDGLQPVGTATVGLDTNHLASALGAAAEINPILTVQVLDSGTFQYLGSIISPVGGSPVGSPILRVKLQREGGDDSTLEVRQGALEVLPLSSGKTATLHLQPMHRYDVGMGGPGRGGRLTVHGGALGVIIDARGRPLQLPSDAGRRRELYRKWLWTLGG